MWPALERHAIYFFYLPTTRYRRRRQDLLYTACGDCPLLILALERCKQSFRSSQRNQHGRGVAAATGFFPAMRARLSLNRVYKPACHQPTSGEANGGFLLLPKGKSYARSCQCRAHRRVPLTGDHRSCGRPQAPSLGHPDRTVCQGCLIAFS